MTAPRPSYGPRRSRAAPSSRAGCRGCSSGLVLLGAGIALIVRARLGVSPWDVLHQGLASVTGLSFGTVVVLLGLVILVVWIPLGQRLGVGTVLNTLTVGYIANGFLDLIPHIEPLAWRWPCCSAASSSARSGWASTSGPGSGPDHATG